MSNVFGSCEDKDTFVTWETDRFDEFGRPLIRFIPADPEGAPVDLLLDPVSGASIDGEPLEVVEGVIQFPSEIFGVGTVSDDGETYTLELLGQEPVDICLKPLKSVTGDAVDNTDPQNPVISSSSTEISDDGTTIRITTADGVQSDIELEPVLGVSGPGVDNTDPQNPVIAASTTAPTADGTAHVITTDDGVETEVCLEPLKSVTGDAVDNTDPANPVIASSTAVPTADGTGHVLTTADGVETVVTLDPVQGISGLGVDNTDPANPVIRQGTIATDPATGTITHTAADGSETVADLCALTNVCAPTLTQTAPTTYLFDNGHGVQQVIDVNEIDMSITSVAVTNSVVTFTAEDGTGVDLDICAIVAANCNSPMVVNANGSVTYTDNAGTVTTIGPFITSINGQTPGADGALALPTGVQTITGGGVDNTDPANPVITIPDSGVQTVTGDPELVDNTDPANPVILRDPKIDEIKLDQRVVYRVEGVRGMRWQRWGPRSAGQDPLGTDKAAFEARWSGPLDADGMPTHGDGPSDTQGVTTTSRYDGEAGQDEWRVETWIYNNRSTPMEIVDEGGRFESMQVYVACDSTAARVYERYEVEGAPYSSGGNAFLTMQPGDFVRMTIFVHDFEQLSDVYLRWREQGGSTLTDANVYQDRPFITTRLEMYDMCSPSTLPDEEGYLPPVMRCMDVGGAPASTSSGEIAGSPGTDSFGQGYFPGDIVVTLGDGKTVCIPSKSTAPPAVTATAVGTDRGTYAGDPGDTLSFSFADGDTPCSSGTTTYALAGVETNVANVSINPTTGEYTFDTVAEGPWAIRYTILCDGVATATGEDSGVFEQATAGLTAACGYKVEGTCSDTVTNSEAVDGNTAGVFTFDNGIQLKVSIANMTPFGPVGAGADPQPSDLVQVQAFQLRVANAITAAVPGGADVWLDETGVNYDMIFEVIAGPTGKDAPGCPASFSFNLNCTDIDDVLSWMDVGPQATIISTQNVVLEAGSTSKYVIPDGNTNDGEILLDLAGMEIGDTYTMKLQNEKGDAVVFRPQDVCCREGVNLMLDAGGNIVSATDKDGNDIADLSTVSVA